MKLLVAAVGTRMPSWAEEAFAEFAKRMPRELPLELKEIKAEPRSSGRPARGADGRRSRPHPGGAAGALPAGGPGRTRRRPVSAAARRAVAPSGWKRATMRLRHRRTGRPGAGPHEAAAAETLRLSSLTLPHALARVVLAEALYRAASLLKNHPYHRE